MNTAPEKQKVYLGDSVYARFDNHVKGDVWLTTENSKPDDPSNAIYLEPEVFAALIVMRERYEAA